MYNIVMNITEDKIKELKAQHKKERDGRTRDRIKAVLLINKGYDYKQVADILLLDGNCGILCDIGDEIKMAEAIMTLYNDQQQCQELVTNANNNLYRFDILIINDIKKLVDV